MNLLDTGVILYPQGRRDAPPNLRFLYPFDLACKPPIRSLPGPPFAPYGTLAPGGDLRAGVRSGCWSLDRDPSSAGLARAGEAEGGERECPRARARGGSAEGARGKTVFTET
jgi:hypothetical protein